MRPSKTQFSLRIFTAKGTTYATTEADLDQTAHARSKSYKLAYAPIEDSDQTANRGLISRHLALSR